MTPHLRIGTRGSRLALAQAEWVRGRLLAAGLARTAELVVIRTSGDRFADQPLQKIGGKDLFVKEIEEALLWGTIDCGVHSLKDLPADLADGLVVAAVPEREDPRDVILTRDGSGLARLPSGARVGSSSLRRAALAHAARPDLVIEPLRGNVDTRVRRLDEGALDAVILAKAGLRRLGITHPHEEPLSIDVFLPAIGQGALAIESRAGETAAHLRALEDAVSRHAIDAERGFLRAVGGSCLTPLAALATVAGDRLTLRALIAQPDGQRVVRGERHVAVADAAAAGADLGAELLARGGAEILRGLAGGA